MNRELVKVNGTDIECPYENEQHFVAIRSICQALGIDHQKQFERIKTDPILGEVYTDTVYTLDKKGVKQPMFCLPIKYVFGWIFSIDDSKVNAKAKPAFLRYKQECYEALYDHFFLRIKLYELKEREKQRLRLEIAEAKLAKKTMSDQITEKERRLEEVDQMDFKQLKAELKFES